MLKEEYDSNQYGEEYLSAIRNIVGATVTVFIMIYIFWFIIPVTKTAYTRELAGVNTTSTLMKQILPITDNWWVIFPLLIAVCGGYILWSYMTNQDSFDY